ncbi:MAG: histidine--tRNA ligase [bacterium]|nr:histidine--tRNA ligase [bacterium]
MTEMITPRTFKGTRDMLPEDMLVRESIISTIKNIFKIYGFSPLETPAVEHLDILAGKYGEDAEKLLYPLAYKGGKTLALRYDLTVPLARVMAMNPHLTKPFKRYQIQPVWRADNPQLKRGRYREFYQCDVDTVGIEEVIADAEIVALMIDVFKAINFDNIEVRINSRKILRGMVIGAGLPVEGEQDICRSIDKLEKEGLDAVNKELLDKGFEKDGVSSIRKLLEQRITGEAALDLLKSTLGENEALTEGTEEIKEILTVLKEMNVPEEKAVFDFALARGLDYYTGPIFEVIMPNHPEVGSLAGGGRYDDLVGIFSKNSIPATGTSFGLERIHALIKSGIGNFEIKKNELDVLICFFDNESRPECLKFLQQLREEGIFAEMYYRPDKIGKQFNYANKKGIPHVLVYGPEEKAAGKVNLKNMETGKQEKLAVEEVIEYFKSMR